MATPAFRAIGTAVQAPGATLTLVAPSSTAVGDLMLAFVADRGSTTPPTGWTAITAQAQTGGYSGGLTVFSRTAASGDAGASFQFTSTYSTMSGVIAAYSSVTKVDAFATNNAGSVARLTAPTVTTAHANEIVVEAWDVLDSATITAQAPATSRLSSMSNSRGNAFPCVAVADQTQAAAGSSAAATATTGSNTSYWAAISIALGYNAPPNAPTLTSPANNTTFDRTVTQRFSWTFSDSDAGDSQSKYDFYYALQGAAFPATPQVSNAVPNQYYDMPGNTLAAGSYQWKVVTYDSSGAASPPSAAGFFTASTPPAGPTITYPASGGTVQASDSIQWSYPTQTAYQVQRCADNNGSIDTSTVYYDTGTVTDLNNTIRTQALTFPTNNRYEWLQLRIQNNGLWSAWVSERVLVSYTPPPTPSLSVTVGQPNPAAMTIALTNPAASGSAPSATSNYVEASKDGGVTTVWARGNTVTVLPNSSVVFYVPLSGANYSFRVTARADNGTTSTSGWVTP